MPQRQRRFRIEEWQTHSGIHVCPVLMIINDLQDDTVFTLQSRFSHQLYVRRTHKFISKIASAKKATTFHRPIGTQATHTFMFRLRSMQDLDPWVNMNSAVYEINGIVSFLQDSDGSITLGVI